MQFLSHRSSCFEISGKRLCTCVLCSRQILSVPSTQQASHFAVSVLMQSGHPLITLQGQDWPGQTAITVDGGRHLTIRSEGLSTVSQHSLAWQPPSTPFYKCKIRTLSCIFLPRSSTIHNCYGIPEAHVKRLDKRQETASWLPAVFKAETVLLM